METQLAGWDKARGLRAYADRVAAAVAAEADPERTAQLSDWLRRILET